MAKRLSPRPSSEISIGSKHLSVSLARNDHPLTLRGHVDASEVDVGIEGWALDLAEPAKPLRLVLLAGEVVVAETETGLPRPDIAAQIGLGVSAGFRFPPQLGLRLERLVYNDEPLSVVVAGTRLRVPSTRSIPAAHAWLRAAQQENAARFDLTVRLGRLSVDAETAALEPLRPLDRNSIGFIELAAIDRSGRTWIQGWMRRLAVVDTPAILLDQRKISSGFVWTCFERDDLDADACGIIGVLQTEWRPTTRAIAYLFMVGRGLEYLQFAQPLRILDKEEFAQQFRAMAPRCHFGPTTALLDLIEQEETWAGDATDAHAAIDEIFIIPGFGCIAAGWVVNPVRGPRGFALRFGTTVLTADPRTVMYRSREDLASVLPGCLPLLQRAGFIAVFRGHIPSREIGTPTLQIIYQDGRRSNHAVGENTLRVVGRAVAVEELIRAYPSLSRETFFPDLARALRKSARAAADHWQALTVARAERVVVCVLPNDRSGAFLAVEELTFQLGGIGITAGIILVAGSTGSRIDVARLFQAMAEEVTVPCSLFVMDEPTQALAAVTDMLQAVQAKRFLFIGPGIVLTDAGWRNGLDFLNGERDAPHFLQVGDPASFEDESLSSAAAFGWERTAFGRWAAAAPGFLGGFAGDNALGDVAGNRSTAHAAWFGRPLEGSPLARAVNRVPA